MAVSSVTDVAAYFIYKANAQADAGENITHLKLQKLVYYAQGFYLASYGEPLFDEPIHAWLHGPVVPALYTIYQDYGAKPIPTPDDFDPESLGDRVVELLEDVYGVYGQYSAWGLRTLTHEEAPWQDTPQNGVISQEVIKDYFLAHLVNGE